MRARTCFLLYLEDVVWANSANYLFPHQPGNKIQKAKGSVRKQDSGAWGWGVGKKLSKDKNGEKEIKVHDFVQVPCCTI
jgi:hypothetical protein